MGGKVGRIKRREVKKECGREGQRKQVIKKEKREGEENREKGRKSKKGNLKTSSKTIQAGNFWRITNLSIIDCKILILVNNDNTLVQYLQLSQYY